MSTNHDRAEAVDVLQELGLKEYEAKCFVGLTRLSTGTAKQLSEITDVPRTRVYDAIRVLEAQGLVEIQHSSPQQFRAVPMEEATETLRDQYEDRVERLRSALEAVDRVEDGEEDVTQEVWTLAGETAISNRTRGLLEDADEEVVLVIGDEAVFTAELVQVLNDVGGDVDLLVGAVTEALEERVTEAVPSATTYISGLEWLHGDDGDDADDEAAIGRLLLVDRSTFLVSSVTDSSGDEQAVFGSGFGNGLVVVARRLLSQGLLQGRDPGQRAGD
ncbi:MAG: TrmB family transcriptional regulator [Halobacterium sp.]